MSKSILVEQPLMLRATGREINTLLVRGSGDEIALLACCCRDSLPETGSFEMAAFACPVYVYPLRTPRV